MVLELLFVLDVHHALNHQSYHTTTVEAHMPRASCLVVVAPACRVGGGIKVPPPLTNNTI